MKETIRYLREKKSLLQSQVAKRLDISRQTYIKFESGDAEPSVAQLRVLADLYQVPIIAFIENRYSVQEPVAEAATKNKTEETTPPLPPVHHEHLAGHRDLLYDIPPDRPCIVASPSAVYEGVFDGTCVRPLDVDFPARINQKVTITLQDEYLVNKATLIDELYGMLHHLADPDKWPLEEKAWELHCMEKYSPQKSETDIEEEAE